MSSASPVGAYSQFEGSPEFVVDVPGSVTIEQRDADNVFLPAIQRTVTAGLVMAALSAAGISSPLALRRIDIRNVRSTSPQRFITAGDLGFRPEAPFADKISRLLGTPNGWADGSGIAPQLPAISWARDFSEALGGQLSEHLVVAPTLEGGVVIEHQVGSSRWSLDIDPDGEPFIMLIGNGSTESFELADAGAAADSFREFVAKSSASTV